MSNDLLISDFADELVNSCAVNIISFTHYFTPVTDIRKFQRAFDKFLWFYLKFHDIKESLNHIFYKCQQKVGRDKDRVG